MVLRNTNFIAFILFSLSIILFVLSEELIGFGLLGISVGLWLVTFLTKGYLPMAKDFSQHIFSPLGLIKYNVLALFITILIIIVCIFFIDNSLVFAAEEKVNLNVNTTAQIGKVEVSFLSDIFTNIGNAAAYTAGLNIGYKLLKSSPVPPIGKGIISLAFGSVSFLTFRALTVGTQRMQDINVQLGSRTFKSRAEAEQSLNNDTSPTLGEIEVTQNKVDAVQTKIDQQDLNFDVSSESSHFVKSPLEPGDMGDNAVSSVKDIMQGWIENLLPKNNIQASGVNPGDTSTHIVSSLDYETIIELLTDSFFLNIILIFLVLMLTWIITVKTFSDREFKLDWLKSHPLGYYIYSMFTFLFRLWSNTNTLWIYFILFFVLMGCVTNLSISYFVLFFLKY